MTTKRIRDTSKTLPKVLHTGPVLPRILTRKPDTAALAKEAAVWDSGAKTLQGWIDAPEAVPMTSLLNSLRVNNKESLGRLMTHLSHINSLCAIPLIRRILDDTLSRLVKIHELLRDQQFVLDSKNPYELQGVFDGLMADAAEELAGIAGFRTRITRSDKNHFVCTRDLRGDRINFEIDNDRVTRARIG